jgi:hypothetical protein
LYGSGPVFQMSFDTWPGRMGLVRTVGAMRSSIKMDLPSLLWPTTTRLTGMMTPLVDILKYLIN